MENKKRGLRLFYKIFSGYLIALVAITAIALLLMSNADRFSHDSELIETEILPNTLKAKDLQLHVIQVQQWLTDISATRGAPGYDDGYDEAAEHAKAFGEIIQEFTAFYRSHNDNEKVKELAEMQTAFNGYYDMGKHMAATYIEYGPEEGNKIMEEFDPYAEKISEMVDGFVENISGMLVTRIKGISDDSHNLVILGSAVSGISTVLLIVLSIIISLKITKPIKEFSAVLKDISEGEGDLTRKIEVSSRDEIGEMAEYFNNTFAKIRQLVATVQNQSNMLGSVGSNLSSNMTETAAAINQISANIKSIKSQTINQAASVTETSSTMEQISMGISRLNSLIGEQSSNISQSSTIIN
ncbi:MAG: methyl-accepting chemotaxis protein, partial [Treponema sp.]|nr:methyl-accepting chemotaxis protein [Treponema sp.]